MPKGRLTTAGFNANIFKKRLGIPRKTKELIISPGETGTRA
jgi:hypothetical protein